MAVQSLNEQDLAQLRAVVDQMTEVAVLSQEKRKTAQSLGVPLPPFMNIVHMLAADPSTPLERPIEELRVLVEKKLGEGAFDEEKVRELLDETVLLEQDLAEQRKLARSFDVDVFIINKLVEIRIQSPLDQGEGLMNQLLLLYGLQPGASTAAGTQQTQSKCDRLAGIVQERREPVWVRYRQLVLDVVLGVGLGVSAIALLT